MTISTTIGIVDLITATLLWGVIGGFSKTVCRGMDLVSYVAICTTAQFAGSLFYWSVNGTAQLPDATSAITTLNISYLLICGISISFAGYLYFASSRHISISSLTASSLILELVVGCYACYLISSSGIDIVYYSVGLTLSLLGLAIIVTAEAIMEKADLTLIAKTDLDNNEDQVPSSSSLSKSSFHSDTEQGATTPAVETSPLLIASADKAKDNSFMYWVAISGFSGALFSMLSVVSTIEEVSTDAITDPSLVVLLVNTGQLVAIPLVTYLFSHLEILGYIGIRITTWGDFWDNLLACDVVEVAWCCVCGFIITVAMVCQFYAVTVIPFGICYGIIMSQALVSAFFSVVVFRDFQSEILSIEALLFVVGIAVYVLSIQVLLVYAFEY